MRLPARPQSVRDRPISRDMSDVYNRREILRPEIYLRIPFVVVNRRAAKVLMRFSGLKRSPGEEEREGRG